MKALALIPATLLLTTTALCAQGGSLTPPGPPSPTMTTLSGLSSQITTADGKVSAVQTAVGAINTTTSAIQSTVNALRNDPRTVITTAPYTISTPGSYVLGGNLQVSTGNGVLIIADNVTLDLNGFTISSTASPSTGTGVLIGNDRRGVTVKNGFIQGTTVVLGGVFTKGGFDGGVMEGDSTGRDLHVYDVHVSGVGYRGIGLNTSIAKGCLVDRCTVSVCAGFGIIGHTVRASSAVDCENTAIYGTTVSDCEGITLSVFSADGINAREVFNSRGVSVGGSGILGSTVMNSRGSSTTGYGINCSGTASFCRAAHDGGVALLAAIAIGCTVEGTGTVSSSQKHLGTP